MPDTTATSTVTLYRDTGLMPSKNYVIDKISSFLGTPYATIENFQFVELKPRMTIKVQLNQGLLQFGSSADAIDYCFIKRQGRGFQQDRGAYYFVVKKNWKAVNTIELELEMDVLNSFKWDTDYSVSDKTLVKRQLKNRYSKNTSWEYISGEELVSGGMNSIRIKTPLTINAAIKSANNFRILQGSTATSGSVSFTNSQDNSGYFLVSVFSPYEQHIKFSFSYEIYAYMADIDLKSEGINPPLYKKDEKDLPDESGVSWSLLYTNKSNPDPDNLVNPVRCLLYPSEDLNCKVPGTSNTLTSGNVPSNNFIIIANTYNTPVPTFTYNGTDDTPKYDKAGGGNLSRESYYLIAFKTVNSSVEVWTMMGTKLIQNSVANYIGQWNKVATVSSVEVSTTLSSLKGYEVTSLPSCEDWYTNSYYIIAYAQSTISLAALVDAIVKSKDNIDRTDPRHIKLINLPYAPVQYTLDRTTNILTIPEGWRYNSTDGVIELLDFNKKFEHKIQTTIPGPISDVMQRTDGLTLDGTGSRINWDPKLHHSDYYYKKFVYDSFNKTFKSECLDWNKSINENKEEYYFTFDFIDSRNIVSKFMFMFPQYTTGTKGTEDYDNILTVARNNEEVLYNSQYLNYLRSGYNYDLKTKERNAATGAAGIGLSLASLIGSIALTASGYGSGVGVAGIVGSVAGLAGSAINLAKTTAQAEENIQRKLQESQNQAVSVSSADDYDLLDAYSGNMAKMCTYEVSDQMKRALADMFFYSGYVVNEQYKPDVNIRYWFDFLQADLVLNNTNNLTKEITELIKNKFSEGVTFFHSHVLNNVRTWDIKQEKENWEEWIVLANGGAE